MNDTRRHVKITSHQFEGCGWWHCFTNEGLPVVEWHDGNVQTLPSYYGIQFTDECRRARRAEERSRR